MGIQIWEQVIGWAYWAYGNDVPRMMAYRGLFGFSVRPISLLIARFPDA
jgi:hypothetical protein